MFGASEYAGPEWVADVCNVKDGKILENESKNWLANVYKGKGDDLKYVAHTKAFKCCNMY